MRLGASGGIELVLPFDAVTQAQLRAVRPRGFWRSRQGCWEFPLEAALVLRQGFGQRFYDPRRAMAIRAWTDGDLRLALRLLQWASPAQAVSPAMQAA